LAPGDELVVAEWDRETRSMWDGLEIIKTVIEADATIRVLDRSYIDLEAPIGRGFMAMPMICFRIAVALAAGQRRCP
jgi:DNA invertase Pin-like site-specific DNA recombinase